MNPLDTLNRGTARLTYLDADFDIIESGSHVICAVTGVPIPLEALRYWSVARQEAYRDASASLKAELEFSKES